MKAFNELREAARQKRNKAIAAIKEAYEQTLVRIAAVEQDILGRDLSGHRSIAACINSVLPLDREFTIADIVAHLEALNSRRVWRKRSVDCHISWLRQKGIVKRLSKAKGLQQPAMYIRVGVERKQSPFEDMTLVDVAAKVLEGRSLNFTELAIAMLEQGYQTSMTPKGLRNALAVALRKNRGRFVEQGRRWGISN